MTEQEINNLIDSKIGKVKMSQLPEATQTSGLYSIGYTGNQSVKYKANLLQGDPLTVRKTYQTEALALADKNPIDTATSLPLTVGQFVSIVDDGEKNGIYRIGSIGGDGTMSLELQGKLGDLSDYAKKGGSTKTLKEVDDEVSQLSKTSAFFNCSYNPDTGGVKLFTDKEEARNSVPEHLRKRGLILTYRVEGGTGWIIEQYTGTADWSDSDFHFLNLQSLELFGQLRTYGDIEYDPTVRKLTFPSGVAAISDGRRINFSETSLDLPNTFSRIIMRGGILEAIPIDEKLNGEIFLDSDRPRDIHIGVVIPSSGKLAVLDGSGFSLSSNRPLLLNNQRQALVNNAATSINFDLNNRKLIITGGSAIDVVTNGRYTLPETTLDMLNSNTHAKVIYNINTNTISVVNQAAPPANDTLILFTYAYTGIKSTFAVNGIQNYLINGVNENENEVNEPQNDQRFALLNNAATSINFDLNNRKLIITGGTAIDTVGGRYNLPETTLDMLNSIPFAKVIYDIKTNTIIIHNQTAPPANDTLILFTYTYRGYRASFVVNGIQNYLINGVNEVDEVNEPQNEEIAYVSVASRDRINFILGERLIVFKNVYIIDNRGTRIQIPDSSLSMPTGTPAGVVLWSKNENILKIRNQSSASLPGHLMLFNYYYTGDPSFIRVQGLDNYSVHGVPNNRLDFRRIELKAVDNISIDFYNAPTQNGVGSGDDFYLYNITSSQLYTMYDNAIGSKEGVTKTLLGATESENPIDIYKYNIKFRNVRMPNRVKPKIAIVGGTHAGERLGLYTTYQFFDQLVNNPDNSTMVEMLRLNFDWVFIPCNNPYSIDVGRVDGVSSVRWNHNGVDMNRNYDWRWDAFPDTELGSQTYKGSAPFSEKESQIVRDCLISEIENLLLVIDTHNFGSSLGSEHADVWLSCSKRNVFNICSSLSDRIAFEIRKRYDLSENNIVAYADYGLSTPTITSWVNNVLNINALTLETCQTNVYETEGYNYDSDVVTRSLTAYINSIYSISKHLINFENDKIIGLD